MVWNFDESHFKNILTPEIWDMKRQCRMDQIIRNCRKINHAEDGSAEMGLFVKPR